MCCIVFLNLSDKEQVRCAWQGMGPGRETYSNVTGRKFRPEVCEGDRLLVILQCQARTTLGTLGDGGLCTCQCDLASQWDIRQTWDRHVLGTMESAELGPILQRRLLW